MFLETNIPPLPTLVVSSGGKGWVFKQDVTH